jgi:E3 ubiquitin-protein ligase RFWD2
MSDPLSWIPEAQSELSKNAKTVQGAHERLQPHMADLETVYFESRSKSIAFQDGLSTYSALSTFAHDLTVSSKFSKLKTLAVLHYADNFFNYASSIVSSIEFDMDDEYFATAGVTKKIRIYEYAGIVRDYRQWRDGFITRGNPPEPDSEFQPEAADGVVHVASDSEEPEEDDRDQVPRYPSQEMSCNSKISCLSWNTHVKGYLSSSDYEGCVTLWDASVGSKLTQFDEHEKRAWSVDFSDIEPYRLASGGDDSKGNCSDLCRLKANIVKIWAINRKKSVMTIDSKANVCSVKFHPTQSYSISFGSAGKSDLIPRLI